MTGVDIVGSLLRADAGLADVVPNASVKAGRLPDGIELPALLVRIVSSVDRQPLKRGQSTRTVDRVAVTVRAANYRDQGAIIGMVKNICAGVVGDVGGSANVSIITAGTGPDVAGPGNTFEQTQDFRVSFDAT